MSDPFVLILYYSRHGSTLNLAREVAMGLEKQGIASKLKTVPEVSITGSIPEQGDGPGFVTKKDLQACSGLVLGSPTRFGNMAAPLKYFIDSTSDIWLSGGLIDKPAGVFTSSSSMHGGQETTLMSMMLPLLHHGATIVGVPYSEPSLSQTDLGGSPYGASHVAGEANQNPVSAHEIAIAQALGQRVGALVKKLHT